MALAGLLVDLAAYRVQGRNPGVAAARDVDGRKIEREAEQVVAQRFGDELVDLVADLARHAAHDGAGCFFRRRAARRERKRIEEGLDQPDLLIGVGRVADDIEVGVVAVDRLGQHRVAEAIDRVRELRDDRGIEIDVVDLRGREEEIDVRLDGARELLEDEMLVLHLGAEFRHLEQALAVPLQRGDLRRRCRQRRDRRQQPFVEEGEILRRQNRVLGLLGQPIVLGVEDRVDGGQADVLVHAAVAGHIVRVEQFVVIGAGRLRAADDAVVVPDETGRGVRIRRVGDVDQELMAGADRIGEADRGSPVSFHRHIVGGAGDAVRALHHDHRKAVRPLDEIAIGVGRQQRHVVHIRVGQIDAEDVARLRLQHLPGGHAADLDIVGGAELAVGAEIAIGEQLAGRDRIAGRVQAVGAQEHLVRRVRRIGLVLIDERRGGVLVLVNVVRVAQHAVGTGLVGGPRQDHEVGRAARNVERIIRLERNEDRPAVALGDEIEAVIEELAEERHPGVERRGEPGVRRNVREEKDILVVRGAELAVDAGTRDDPHALLQDIIGRVQHAIRTGVVGVGIRRRIVGGLIDHEVADGSRLRVENGAAGLRIG